MIGLDTTFLIDLYWKDSPRHESAVKLFKELSDENGLYASEELLSNGVIWSG